MNQPELVWGVIEYLKTMYAEITKDNGFKTDIGKHVTIEPAAQVEVETLPDLTITARPNFADRTEKRTAQSFRSWDVDVFVESRVPLEDQAQKTAWDAMADMIKGTKLPEKMTLPQGAHSLQMIAADILPPLPEQSFLVVQLQLKLSVLTQ